jgi:hypothetical protein
MKCRRGHEWLMNKWLVMLDCRPAGRPSKTMWPRRRGRDRGGQNRPVEFRAAIRSKSGHRPYPGWITTGDPSPAQAQWARGAGDRGTGACSGPRTERRRHREPQNGALNEKIPPSDATSQ